MLDTETEIEAVLSPSSRRAWIEISRAAKWCAIIYGSPSSRRAWIEIKPLHRLCLVVRVALLAEGVDRNSMYRTVPYGKIESPSSRRAWIEMRAGQTPESTGSGRPPRGGRG